MEINRSESLICNKCGHIFNEYDKAYLLLCPECKKIKKINFSNIEV